MPISHSPEHTSSSYVFAPVSNARRRCSSVTDAGSSGLKSVKPVNFICATPAHHYHARFISVPGSLGLSLIRMICHVVCYHRERETPPIVLLLGKCIIGTGVNGHTAIPTPATYTPTPAAATKIHDLDLSSALHHSQSPELSMAWLAGDSPLSAP